MKPLLKSAIVVAATILGTAAVTAVLFAILRPCRVGDVTGLLFYGLSVPPALTYLLFRYRRSDEFWASFARSCGLWVLLALFLSIALSDLFGAVNRSKQKRAMAQLRLLGQQYEQRRQAGQLRTSPPVGPLDPWGHPIVVATTAQRYVLVSCGECGGPPERQNLFAYSAGPTTDFTSDIVFSDGVFVAYPEGIQH